MKNIVSIFAILFTVIITATSCGPSAVVVKERPPLPVYVRPAPPRANYVWIEPSYVRSGRGYVLRQGYWAPPKYNRPYTQGYWKTTRRGYVWVPGRW